MKKATNKKEAAAPVNLGTKRHCPKCNTKFYDFAKAEIVCPKCETPLDPEALNPVAKLVQPKKARVVEETPVASEEVAVGDSEDVIESVDDLGDDEDEEIVEDLVDEEEQESY